MIWLLGCNGMLGKELSALFSKNSIVFTGTGSDLDITNQQALLNFSKTNQFDWIINCAAYTAVDKAENDSDKCWRINMDGAINISNIACTIDAKFIHISTDYVFDGKASHSYKETDESVPIGIYGASKLAGEKAIIKTNANAYIIRTAWLYGNFGNNFVKTMIRMMADKNSIKVVNDQYGTPTWTFDLAQIILTIIKNHTSTHLPYGIYHYTNGGKCSWFEFATDIYHLARKYNILKTECNVMPCSSEEYPAKVKRPKYSVLDKTKIQQGLDIQIPHWQYSLCCFMKEYGANYAFVE